MSKYQHILVAVDLKEKDDNPVSEQAQLLANASGAKLSVIHVIEPIYTYGIAPGGELQFDEWEKSIEDTAKKQLKKLCDKLSIPENQQILKIGSPRSLIMNAAENIGADLIVVGHHGRHGLSAILIGNTAEDMVHRAKCDVLAVHVPND